MAGQKPMSLLLLSAILFLVGHLLNIKTGAQLLPIVGPYSEANTSKIQTYIVYVDGAEDADLLSYEDRESWYMSFLPNSTLDSGEPRLLYSYQHVISGFAARLTHEELKAMESMDGLVLAELDRVHPLDTTYTPQFLEMNKYGNSIWAKSNGGEGVIIGVLDTGIVPDHPSFNDSGMPSPPFKWRGCCQFKQKICDRFVPSFCNNKLLGARSYGLPLSPLDKNGHGSHVAGTAAGVTVYNAGVLDQAKGTAVGMAPRAHLAVYRVCTRSGCPNSNVLAAIDQAIEDGVDVLSMSLGSGPEPFHRSSVIKGTYIAMEKKGILASCGAGNNGRLPLDISNDAPWIMTVGASTTDRAMRVAVQLGNGMELCGESAYQPENYTSPWLPIAYPGRTPTDAKKACVNGSLADENVKGMMVLCGETNSERLDKGRTVKEAQGAALIVLNQIWNGHTTWAEAHVLPAAHLSHVDSLKIVDYAVAEAKPTARLIFQGTQYGKRRSPAVTDFSSRGPSTINGGILKPDIIGPGSNILAAWAANEVGPDASGPSTSAFNFASGTSMSTPHLAGIAALIKSIHRDWSPAAIKSAIMTTADTLDHDGLPIVDEKSNSLEQATYFAMGAGHVNPSKAMDPGLVYDVQPDDYVSYLCSLYNDFEVKLIVKRYIQCHKLQPITAEQLNSPSIMVSLVSSSSKAITRKVTYVGEEARADYKLEVSEPEGTVMDINPKELHFSSPKETQTFTVKFTKKSRSPNQQYTEGYFAWVSSKHIVRSPIVVKHQDS